MASLLTGRIAVSCGSAAACREPCRLLKKVIRTPVACQQSRVGRRAASIVVLPLSVFRLGFFYAGISDVDNKVGNSFPGKPVFYCANDNKDFDCEVNFRF